MNDDRISLRQFIGALIVSAALGFIVFLIVRELLALGFIAWSVP